MSTDLVRSGLSALRSLERADAISLVHLELPPGISFDRYEAIGRSLGLLKRATSWMIGDWILYGEATFGEKCAQASEVTGLSPDTLANYASVCKRVVRSRRKAGVPFSVHSEVAAMSPQNQRRWLSIAEREQLSQRELRQRIREEAGFLPGRGEEGSTATSPLGGERGQADTPSGVVAQRNSANGLPPLYAIDGATCRRLVREGIPLPRKPGWVAIPRELYENIASTIREE